LEEWKTDVEEDEVDVDLTTDDDWTLVAEEAEMEENMLLALAADAVESA